MSWVGGRVKYEESRLGVAPKVEREDRGGALPFLVALLLLLLVLLLFVVDDAVGIGGRA